MHIFLKFERSLAGFDLEMLHKQNHQDFKLGFYNKHSLILKNKTIQEVGSDHANSHG